MNTLNEITFEQAYEYLVKVVCPDVNFLYPAPIPSVNTPDAETIIYYYSKHFPDRNAPKLAAIEEGYSWIWKEFETKTEGKIWSLDKESRAEFIKQMVNFFDLLKVDKEAYSCQIPFLKTFGEEQLLAFPEVEQSLLSYEGNTVTRQAKALEMAVWVIQEAICFFDKFRKDTPLSVQTKAPYEEKPSVFIFGSMQTRLFKTLSDYIPTEYREELELLLTNGYSNNRIWVKMRADSLAYLFKQARHSSSNPITSDMTETAKWLATYFSYGKNRPKAVSEKTMYNILRDNRIVAKSNQIRLKA